MIKQPSERTERWIMMQIETLSNRVIELQAKLLKRPITWNTQIRDLGDEDYILRDPILIVIEEYPDETVIAEFPEIEALGEGTTAREAMQDLKHAILDLYDHLSEAAPDTLGKLPAMWLRILEQLITRRIVQ